MEVSGEVHATTVNMNEVQIEIDRSYHTPTISNDIKIKKYKQAGAVVTFCLLTESD